MHTMNNNNVHHHIVVVVTIVDVDEDVVDRHVISIMIYSQVHHDVTIATASVIPLMTVHLNTLVLVASPAARLATHHHHATATNDQ